MDIDAEMKRLRAEVERLTRECEAQRRELHRIACGVPIESDALCEYAIEAVTLRAEVERYKGAAFETETRASGLGAERDVAKAFHDVAVNQRNAAWAEVQRLLEDNVRWVDASDALGTELASERERVERLRRWILTRDAYDSHEGTIQWDNHAAARAALQPGDLR